MRKKLLFLSILVLFFMFSEVAFAKKDVLFASKKIKVYVDKSQVTENFSPKQLLLRDAEKKVTKEIMSGWIQQDLLFEKKNINFFEDGFSSFIIIKDNFTPYFETASGIYEQLFKVDMELLPCNQILGDIIFIEGDKTLAASHYYVSIRLKGLIPDSNGSYFIIARPRVYNDEHRKSPKSFYEIIGGGKIYRVVQSVAQGIILVSSHEVSKNDKIFLVKTKIAPVVKAKKQKGLQEVIVEPEIIKVPEVPVPKEAK